MSIRILHSADLHLGAEYKSFHLKSAELQQESLSAFEKLINYAVDPYNEIKIFIIAGDLFDNPSPEPGLVEKVKKLLLKITEKNIKLYILPGNHDSYSYKNSIYRATEFPGMIIKNPDFELIDKVTINDGTIFIYSGIYELNNPDKRILNRFKIIQEPGIHVGILHGTLESSEIKVSERDLPFSFEEFTETGLNYLALGHFHNHKEKEADPEHKMAYPGSLLPRSIDEYGNKYSLVIDTKLFTPIQIQTLQFSKIRVEKKVIDLIKEGINDMDGLIRLLKQDIDPYLILDIYLEGIMDSPFNENTLKTGLEGFFFYVRINNNIKFIKSSVIDRIKNEETIRGLFFKKMLEKSVIINYNKQNIINQSINLGLRDFIPSDLNEKSKILNKIHKISDEL